MKKLVFALLGALVLAASCGGPRDLDSQYAKDLIKKGEMIPEFTLNSLDSVAYNRDSFKGEYLVLDFWATWCPDCRADIPAMKQLQAEYGGKARFVGISFDTEREALESYVADNEISWLQLSDFAGKKESTVGEAFHVKWIPSVYLVDPEGKVVLGTVMVDKLRAALEKL